MVLLVGGPTSGQDALQAPAAQPAPQVTPVPAEFRAQHKLDPFYEKYVSYQGYAILSSAKVPDEALLEARYLISQMLARRDDITAALVARKCRFTVMAPDEMTTDVPEQRNMQPKDYWDRRARGLGGQITSCGAENLLNLRGDRYRRENILIHEFAHCIHEQGLRVADKSFDGRLRETYRKAMDTGLWAKTYAAENHKEYWAEGVQAYFDCQAPPGGVHNDIDRREKLEKYDPELFKLIDEVFQQSKFRYVRYADRQPSPKPATE
jgi:alpha-glucosidase